MVYLGIYIILLVLYVRKRARTYLLLMLVNTVAALTFYMEQKETEHYREGVIERNAYGAGDKKEEVTVRLDGQKEDRELILDVQERKYEEDQVEHMLQEAVEGLDSLILGRNASLDRVETDLYFPKTYPHLPVALAWETNSYDVLDFDGQITAEHVPREGVPVEIRAIASCQEQEAVYEKTVTVVPRELEGEEKWIAAVQKEMKEKEEETRTKPTFTLPSEVEGTSIQWGKRPAPTGYLVLLFGGAIVLLLPLLEKEREKKKEKKRSNQLHLDYSELLNRLVLLLDTGMTLRSAWNKIVEQYRKEKTLRGERQVYEEMAYTIGEMRGGITEADGYLRFGKRCALPEYRKLGVMLSRNLRKGTKGLVEMLETEEELASQERKNRAKKLGEEAGTKLLFPMSMMLVVVLVIVIVPAFLSIQL